MRKLVFISVLYFSFLQSNAQGQFPSLSALRTFINTYIRNNAVESFQQLRLNQALNGLVDFSGGLSTGTAGVDTLVRVDDTSFYFRLKGINYYINLRGVYDARRKVDTIYSLSDTSLAFTINGLTRTAIIKGINSYANSLSSLGNGYKIAVTGTLNAKSLNKGVGILLDSATVGEVTVKADTSLLFVQLRNSFRKVDTLWAVNDTLIRATINGVSFDITVRGKTGSGNVSIGGGVKINQDLTNNIKSLINGYGVSIIDSPQYVTLKVDTATMFPTIRGMFSKRITGLDGDVYTTGDSGVVTATINLGAVTNAKFRNSAAQSVVGRASATSGVVGDIQANANGDVLRLASLGLGGSVLAFGRIDSVSVNGLHSEAYYNGKYAKYGLLSSNVLNQGTGVNLTYMTNDTLRIKTVKASGINSITRNADSSITIVNNGISELSTDVTTGVPNLGVAVATISPNVVDSTKFRKSRALSVVGNPTNALANTTDISATATGQVLKRSGTALVFGTIDSTNAPDLHSQAYYDGRYFSNQAVKNYIKNAGTGTEISFTQVDTVKLKRLQAGAGITITRNTDSSLSLASTITQGITSFSGDVNSTGNPTATATIQNNAVTSAKFRTSAALSVVGNATNATANVNDIAAAADFQVLKRAGTSLVFGTLDSTNVPALRSQAYYDGRYSALNSTKNFIKNTTTGIEMGYLQVDTFRVKRVQAGTNITITRNADSSLTFAAASASGITSLTGDVTSTGSPTATTTIGANKVLNTMIRQSAATSVVGNSTALTANVADISATADGQVLKRSGTTLAFATLDSVSVPSLRSQGYYDGRYAPINSTKNFIKNAGTGVELGYVQIDTFKVKRVQAGTGITITRNVDSSLTVASTVTQGATGFTGDVASSGTLPTLTATIQANAVTAAKFRQSVALSVVGNATNLAANVTDISTTADFQVLKRSGTSLVFGTLDSTNVPALRSQGYYDGRYAPINSTKNFIKNAGSGVELGFLQVDTFKVKRVQAGAGITITRNIDSSLSVASSITQGIVSFTGDVNSTGNPNATTLIQPSAVTTTKIADNNVTSAKFRQSAALSVVGNNTNALANVTDISASADGQVLKRSSSALSFGTLDSTSVPDLHSENYYNGKYLKTPQLSTYIKQVGAGTQLGYQQVDTFKIKRVQAGAGIQIVTGLDSSITITNSSAASGVTGLTGDVVPVNGPGVVTVTVAANAISDAKLRSGTAYSVIGRSTSTAGNVADISATTNGHVLRLSGTALGFGTLDSVSIPTLRSQAYYDGRYLPILGVDNYVKNIGTGVNLSFNRNDSVIIKNVNAGTNLSIVRNADSSLTLNATGDGTGITTLTNDISATGSGSVAATINANVVTNSKIRKSAATSLIGNATNALADVTDISATVDNTVLRRTGGALSFGTLDSTAIPALRSESYYNTKFAALNSTKNFIKNGGAGVELTYINNDTVRVKRIQQGTGVTIVRNTDSSLTVNATAQPVTVTLGGDLSGSGTTPNTISTTIVNGAVSDGKLRTSSAWSVIGRSLNTGGSVADITATAANQVLRVSGTTLGFSLIDSNSLASNSVPGSKIPDYTITNTKIRQSAGNSVIGRASNLQGDVGDIASSADWQVLRRVSGTLGWGSLDSNSIPDLHSENYYNGKYAKVGGATTQVQYNNAGVLAGSSGFTFDNATIKQTLTGNTPTLFLKDTAVAGRYSNLQSRRVVINDTVNTADNGYVFQVYKDSTNRAIFTNGNVAMHGTQRGTASDSLFIVKGVDSILRQTAVKTVNGVSILGSGNIVTAASAGAAGGSDQTLQYNSLGTLAGASNITLPVNPVNSSSRDLKFTDGSLYYFNGSTNSWSNFSASPPDYHLVYDQTTGKVYYNQDIRRQGTYTPTVTAGTNVSLAPSALTCYYSRIGNQVTVWGGLTVQAVTNGANTDVFISLPPVSTCTVSFANIQQLVGTASTQYSNTMCTIIGDVTNVRANMKWIAPSNLSRQYFFQFSYYLTETCN